MTKKGVLVSEKLISGYVAFTTPEEFAATPVGEAPGTLPIITTPAFSALGTHLTHC